MKTAETLVAVTNSSEAGQKNYTVAGLPLSTAIVYASLFAVAFWFYSAVWTGAPFLAPDSPGYIRVAQDLSDFHVDQLNARPPGYPLLLVLTGSGRPLFYTSLALHFASIWLLSAVLYAMGLTRGWLVLPALLLLLPPYVEYAAYVLSDNLSEFLLVLAFSSLVFWFLRGRGSGSANIVRHCDCVQRSYQADLSDPRFSCRRIFADDAMGGRREGYQLPRLY